MMSFYWEHHRTDFIILMSALTALFCAILYGSRWIRKRKQAKE